SSRPGNELNSRGLVVYSAESRTTSESEMLVTSSMSSMMPGSGMINRPMTSTTATASPTSAPPLLGAAVVVTGFAAIAAIRPCLQRDAISGDMPSVRRVHAAGESRMRELQLPRDTARQELPFPHEHA